jgi:hypothetical protein
MMVSRGQVKKEVVPYCLIDIGFPVLQDGNDGDG